MKTPPEPCRCAQPPVSNPECGLSWSGFNIRGDAKSIREVRRLMNMEQYHREQSEQLRGMLDETR